MKLIKNQKGQSLLELIIALGVLTVGVFAVWSLLAANYRGESEVRARVVAINLAREGIEVVKNIRDSNWFKIDNGRGIAWTDGLIGSDSTARISNLLADVGLDFSVNNLTDAGAKLYLTDAGYFTSTVTTRPTIYRRLITVKSICCADSAPRDFQCDDFNFNPPQTAICDAATQLTVGLDVASQVSWTVEGKTSQVTVQDQIFNWR